MQEYEKRNYGGRYRGEERRRNIKGLGEEGRRRNIERVGEESRRRNAERARRRIREEKRRKRFLRLGVFAAAAAVVILALGGRKLWLSFLERQYSIPSAAESYGENMAVAVNVNADGNSEEPINSGGNSDGNSNEPINSGGNSDGNSNEPINTGGNSNEPINTGGDLNGNSDGQISGSAVDLSGLYSRYAILVDLESGNTLAENRAQERIYPASMTKIMTALLAVENTEDMEETVTVPEYFFQELYAEEASMAGFQPGERARLRDLLYGILLPSGAECCMTFADRIAGSEEGFVQLMNQRAGELGMRNTHFCNSTGLHDPEHYTTVEDISILLRYALQNAAFREAFTGSRYSTMPTDQHPEGFTFYSTMFQYMDSPEVTGGEILGGKTGYTEEAGQCLASMAVVNGKNYILVTAKADGSHETEQFHILDARNVYSQIGAGAN